MPDTNSYCQALGIKVPRLEGVTEHPDANFYSLLLVALLERGEPITLEQAAVRLEQAGAGPAGRVLASLKRCKPARPPIYRDEDLYALDPHDDAADLWAFRLGLRPPKVATPSAVLPEPAPLPSPNEPLTVAILDEAWRGWIPSCWSAQRSAICVLDACGTPLLPQDVLAFIKARCQWSMLSADSAQYWRRGAAIRVLADGCWALDPSHPSVRSARQAVVQRISVARRYAHLRSDPETIAANSLSYEMKRREHGNQLARMNRVIVHAFPAGEPEAVALVDVEQHRITSHLGGELARAREALARYDIIAGVDIRAVLRRLGFEPGALRLAELGPPQKSKQLNRRGRTLRITLEMLIRGSCGISRPFGEEAILWGYLRRGEITKFRSRLEADAKSLYALYQYGRLHGAVRLRWGFLDEKIAAPWVHRDETTLYGLMQQAHELQRPLEVVTGTAPGWANPWSRVAQVQVERRDWQWLLFEEGCWIDEADVQLARLAGEGGEE